MDGIESLNYKTATPIQAQAIPLIIEGRDLIGIAQTGTGKTAAFVLPILHKILESDEMGFTQALVLVPTRELALQIDQMIEAYSYFTGISSIAIYGGGDGQSFGQEKTALTSGVDVIVATPGRLIAHIKMGYVKLDQLRYLVLDEADRMLNMGFKPDLMRIVDVLNKERQSLLFSATMPPEVMKFANTLLRDPVKITIALSKPAAGVAQLVYELPEELKNNLIVQLLKGRQGQRVIVFCSTRRAVADLYRVLKNKNLPVAMVSSDIEQEQREQIMQDYRNRKTDILVATDVLSRGIDVEGIDVVFNFDAPRDPEDYVHRIGRTGRAERSGEAVTLISPKDRKRFQMIERLIGNTIKREALPPELAAASSGSGGERRPDSRRVSESRSKRRPAAPASGPSLSARTPPSQPRTSDASPQTADDKKPRRRNRRRSSKPKQGE